VNCNSRRVVWGTAALVALSGSAAMAQESATDAKLRELSEKIERMRVESDRQIAQLQEQQKQLEALRNAVLAPTPAPPAIPGVVPAARGVAPTPLTTPVPAANEPAPEYVMKGTLPGSFRVPGTDTSIKIGGFARLDIVKDFGGGSFGAIAIPSLVPFGGSAQASRKGYFNENARESRLYVRTQTDTSYGPVMTYIEGDFIGAGGNETVTNSSAFRIRQAYLEAGPWLAGQTWTNFVDLGSYHETIDFAGGQGNVQGIRDGQLRYTQRWGTTQQLSIALENPESDIFGTVVTTEAAASSPTSTTTLDTAPDVNARYQLTGDWGRISLGAMARHLVFNNTGGAPINGFVGGTGVTAYQWALQGKVNTFGKDSIQYSLAGGAGVGRYLLGSVSNTAAVIENGRLKAIQEVGATVSYQHFWTPTLRSNLIYGQVKSDLPHPYVPLTTPNKVAVVFANLIWSPVPSSLIGVEWERGMVENDSVSTPASSNHGSNNRLLTSFQYGF
jgi:hypothetical protein